MALPVLRHYRLFYNVAGGTNSGYLANTPSVPAGRALVVSRLSLATDTGALFYVVISPGTAAVGAGVGQDNAGRIAANVILNPGEVYTETGLVIPAGEQMMTFISSLNGNQALVAVNVFGEEVDN